MEKLDLKDIKDSADLLKAAEGTMKYSFHITLLW